MYLEFFNLDKEPFTLTPDTRFFLDSGPFKDALETLIIAIENGEGFIKVTGEVGTGKTLLCRKLLNTVAENIVTSYIPNPNISSKTLTVSIARELGMKYPASANEYTLQQLITTKLMQYYQNNQKVILCIDEAQAMPDKTLEALRLLTNLETEQGKLLQIILFGQPELDEKLKSRHLRQFRQRVSFSITLKHLNMDVMVEYLSCRLLIAGYKGGQLFPLKSLKLLHRYSRGIPRLINLIVHKAMLLCYGKGEKQITTAIMKQAIKDTEDAYEEKASNALRYKLITAVVLIISIVSAVYWAYQ